MIGFLIIGLGLFVGLVSGVFSKVPNQATVKGEIVSTPYEYRTDENKPTFYAWVEYEVNGTVYSIKSKTRSSSYRVGQKKTVAYDKTNPQNANIRPGMSVCVVMAVLFCIGIIACINPELIGFK